MGLNGLGRIMYIRHVLHVSSVFTIPISKCVEHKNIVHTYRMSHLVLSQMSLPHSQFFFFHRRFLLSRIAYHKMSLSILDLQHYFHIPRILRASFVFIIWKEVDRRRRPAMPSSFCAGWEWRGRGRSHDTVRCSNRIVFLELQHEGFRIMIRLQLGKFGSAEKRQLHFVRMLFVKQTLPLFQSFQRQSAEKRLVMRFRRIRSSASATYTRILIGIIARVAARFRDRRTVEL